MRAKLGFFHEEPEDLSLIEDLMNLMQRYQADYTNTFLALTFGKTEDTPIFLSEDYARWHSIWKARLERQGETRAMAYQRMKDSNPALIPRNHRVEAALDAAVHGDNSIMLKFLKVLSKPYVHTCEQAEYAVMPAPSSRPYKTFCGT